MGRFGTVTHATLSHDRKPTARHAAEARRKNASAFVNKV